MTKFKGGGFTVAAGGHECIPVLDGGASESGGFSLEDIERLWAHFEGLRKRTKLCQGREGVPSDGDPGFCEQVRHRRQEDAEAAEHIEEQRARRRLLHACACTTLGDGPAMAKRATFLQVMNLTTGRQNTFSVGGALLVAGEDLLYDDAADDEGLFLLLCGVLHCGEVSHRTARVIQVEFPTVDAEAEASLGTPIHISRTYASRQVASKFKVLVFVEQVQ